MPLPQLPKIYTLYSDNVIAANYFFFLIATIANFFFPIIWFSLRALTLRAPTWAAGMSRRNFGDGELSNSEGEALIEIPHDLLIQPGPHPFNDIVKATYPDFDTKFSNAK